MHFSSAVLGGERKKSRLYNGILYPDGRDEAEYRTRRLYLAHCFLLVVHLCYLIGLTVGTIIVQVVVAHKSDLFYYVGQLVVEVLLFSCAISMVCNPSQWLGIVLIGGHLSVSFSAATTASKSVKRKQIECWGNEDCLISQLDVKHHLFYLGATVILAHVLMSIISMMIIWYYEGSIDHVEKTTNLSAYLEARLAAHALPNYCRNRKSTTTIVLPDKKPAVKDQTSQPPVVRQEIVTATKTTTKSSSKSEESPSQRVRKEPSYVANAQTPKPESPLSYLRRKEAEGASTAV